MTNWNDINIDLINESMGWLEVKPSNPEEEIPWEDLPEDFLEW